MGGSSAWAYLRMVSRAIPGSLAMAGTHGSVYVMNLMRTTVGINKVESVRMMVTRERSGNGMRMSGSGPID